MDQRRITVSVNGNSRTETVSTRLTLADFLRHKLGLNGTHIVCEHVVCGACTILVDGRSARSCLMLAVQADGHDITTVEGLEASDGTLHPLQQAFADHHLCRCTGYQSIISATLDAAKRMRMEPT